jgi:cytochrome c oxidase subunit 3
MSTAAMSAETGNQYRLAAGEQRRRDFALQFGMWVFLATATMLFAAFSSAYIVRQSGTDWRYLTLPSVLWLNTLLLVVSSVAIEIARVDARHGKWRGASASVVATALLGIAFVVGQFAAWRDLVAQGVYIPTNPYSSFFYILTGLHVLHLTAGLMFLLYVAWRIFRRAGVAESASLSSLLNLSATFWHFFGALWIYLFVLLTLF